MSGNPADLGLRKAVLSSVPDGYLDWMGDLYRQRATLASQQYILPSYELLACGHCFTPLSPARSAAYSNAYAATVGM